MTESLVINKEEQKHEMVAATHKKKKEDGTFETINDVYRRLPISRLEKNNYKFLFSQIKSKSQSLLSEQDRVWEIQKKEHEAIQRIEIKLGKPNKYLNREEFYEEKLKSNKMIFSSLVYMKNQSDLNSEELKGERESFLKNIEYIDLTSSKNEISNIRLFMEDMPKIKKLFFKFTSENEMILDKNILPLSHEIENRAEILANLYLLQLYREEGQKQLMINHKEEIDLENERKIKKIRQELDLSKMKEGSLIQDTDLIMQVNKVIELIEKKMNSLAYEEFKAKNGAKAIQIKKSLEKLKNSIASEPEPKIKLKNLIAYKYKKGW